MLRPRYCTEQDRAKEKEVLGRFTAIVAATNRDNKWEVQHAFQDMDVDGVLLKDGKPAYAIEIKNRTGSGLRFSTWHIAKDKIDRCRAFAAERNMQFILLMVWDGEIYSILGDRIPMNDLRSGGRTDRGDAHDVETMVHIPANLFKHCR